MQTKEFKSGKVSAIVREETGDDVLTKRRLLTKVYDKDDPEAVDKWYEFFDILVQSDAVVVPFRWPKVTASIEELAQARDCFFALPGRVYRQWKDALSEVNTDPDDPDLLPAENVPAPKEVTPTFSENEPILESM